MIAGRREPGLDRQRAEQGQNDRPRPSDQAQADSGGCVASDRASGAVAGWLALSGPLAHPSAVAGFRGHRLSECRLSRGWVEAGWRRRSGCLHWPDASTGPDRSVMLSASAGESPSRYDRALLLAPEKRSKVLTLEEVERYGADSYDDPDYVSLYGMAPAAWYARGVRILSRTAVECTRDALADRIGRDVAAVAASVRPAAGVLVLDPFAGSANTLWWLQRRMSAPGVGFELDAAVFAGTTANLRIVSSGLALHHTSYEAGIAALSVPAGQLVVVFVAPPWGDALDIDTGLDLAATSPPVLEIHDRVDAVFPRHPLLFATQIYETVQPRSLAGVVDWYEWSTQTSYPLNRPGRNHGLLIGSRRVTPQDHRRGQHTR